MLDKVSDAGDNEWKELCAEVIEENSWVIGGMDEKTSKLVGGKIEQWLKKVRAARGKDFSQKRPELERGARELAGLVAPAQVLENFAAHGLAEMLSNPRLAPALEARLKK